MTDSDQAENQIIDLNLAVSAMIERNNQMQENFIAVMSEIRSLRSDFIKLRSQFLEELQRRRNEEN